jgi:hypothetical protein
MILVPKVVGTRALPGGVLVIWPLES